MRALLLGALVGGAVAGVLAWRTSMKLRERAALLQVALTTQGGEAAAVLLQGGAALQRDLATDGAAYARTVSQRTAEDVLGRVYGLTPDRMRRLGVAADAMTQASLVVARTTASVLT
jgi:hypothetical protein